MASSFVAFLGMSLLGCSATLDVAVWSNIRFTTENSRALWNENSEGLVNQVYTASKVVMLVAEDSSCLTQLLIEDCDCVMLHDAPRDVERKLLEVVRDKNGVEDILEIFAADLKSDDVAMTSSVFILHVHPDSIRKAEKLIGDLILSQLEEVVVFASMPATEDDKMWQSRHLLAASESADADNKTETTHDKIVISTSNPIENGSQILLYAGRLTITVNNESVDCCSIERDTKLAVVLQNVFAFNDTENNHRGLGISVDISDAFQGQRNLSVNVTDAYLIIYVFLKNSFWSVKKMEFNAMIDGKETSVLLKSTNRTDTSYQKSIKGVPKRTAFKCTPEIVYTNISHQLDSETANITVTFTNLQFDPFLHGAGKNFTNLVNDCVGYFTPGIWAGVVTSLLLIVILYLAIYLMLGMQIMDRFDDPKGKPLNIQS